MLDWVGNLFLKQKDGKSKDIYIRRRLNNEFYFWWSVDLQVRCSTSGTQTAITREAPRVEARKLSLYDQAAKLAATPVDLPAVQVAPLSGIEQAGIQQARQTGVGAPTIQAGYCCSSTSTTSTNISQFFNPYQSYVTDEINRQAQMAQNQLATKQFNLAFGGARQGVAQAELERARLAQVGQAQAQGFGWQISSVPTTTKTTTCCWPTVRCIRCSTTGNGSCRHTITITSWRITKRYWPSCIRCTKTDCITKSI